MSRFGRRANGRVALTVLSLLILVFVPVQGKVVSLETDFASPVSTGIGGRTMLVEEITATWCPSCAEIDPELMMVADSHGSRIGLIALHPTGLAEKDAFEPPASQHRIDRLRLSQPSLGNSTPTFLVEGGEPRVGYDAWAEVQRDILNTELARQQVTELAFEVERTDTGYRASVTHANLLRSNGTQLTFLVLEHGKEMPSGAINPGEDIRDRVLIGVAECHVESANITTTIGLLNASVASGCTDSFSVEFEALTSWSVLLIHEPTADNIEQGQRVSTFGAVELAHRDRASEQDSGSFAGTVLVAASVLLGMASLARKK